MASIKGASANHSSDLRTPYRRALRWLYVVAPLFTVAGIAVASLYRHDQLYSMGGISPGHARFGGDCAQCHTGASRTLRSGGGMKAAMAFNAECLRCHGRTIGHSGGHGDEANTATHHERAPGDGRPCSRCHGEHQDKSLVPASDEACIECHRDLRAVEKEVGVTAGIGAFGGPGIVPAESGIALHPEFRVLAEKHPDPGTLKFNHRRHLMDDKLPGPDGKPARLQCHDCHRGAGAEPLPFRFGVNPPNTLVADARSVDRSALMAPISYASHCAGCHRISVPASRGRLRGDDAVARDEVPHTTPGAIRNYLRSQLSSQLSSQLPSQLHNSSSTEFAEIETSLYGVEGAGCRACHQVKEGRAEEGALPRIVPTAIPSRFFPRAAFNHAKHAAAALGRSAVPGAPDCLVCHPRAVESTRATDLLVPGIANCRGCHGPALGNPGTSTYAGGGVPALCTTCHTYHVPPPSALGPVPLDESAGAHAGLPSLVAAGRNETLEGLRNSTPLWRLSAFFELPAKVWGRPDIQPGTEEFRREVFRRYGLHWGDAPNDGLPIGLLRTRRTLDGEPGYTVSCEYCHTSSILGRVVVGQPNPWSNLERIWDDMTIGSRKVGAQFYFKNPLGNTVVNGADHLGLLGLILRNEDFSGDLTTIFRFDLNLTPEYQSAFDALAYIKTPPWYQYATRKSGAAGLYWDGGQPKDGNFAAYTYMITFRDFDGRDLADALDAWKKGGPAFLSSLTSPGYPFPVDRPRSVRGRRVFEERCARCHGTYGAGAVNAETLSYPGVVIPIEEVKTDPKRSHFPPFFVERTRAVLKEEYTVTDGYAAPPLTAIWARAPYLHNGSVPTLQELLDPPSRRTGYVLSADPDRPEDFDQARVGWRVDPLPEKPDPFLRIFDPARIPGLANTGHLYGADLSIDQKLDLIEFLKTL